LNRLTPVIHRASTIAQSNKCDWVTKMNERSYVIGRKGQIQLSDKTTSAKHARLVVKQNNFYIVDLNSTNGTYLVDGDKKLPFKEGYVQLNQTMAFGNHICSVRELVARAEIA